MPRFSLAMRLGLLLLVPIAGALIAVLVFQRYVVGIGDMTMTVDVAGGQRMLAVDLRSWAHMVSMGQEGDREGLRERVARFERRLVALEHGGLVEGRALPPPSPGLVPALADLRAFWTAYRRALERVADLPRVDPGFGPSYEAVEAGAKGLLERTEAVVAVYQREGLARRKGVFRVLGGVAALDALLLLVVLGLVHRMILRPVRALARGATRVGAGDFDHRVEVATGDDFHDLALAFNAMAGRIGGLVAEIESSRRYLQKIYASAPGGFVVLSEDLRVADVNSAFCRILGVGREGAVGLPLSRLIPVGDLEEAVRGVYATGETRLRVPFEFGAGEEQRALRITIAVMEGGDARTRGLLIVEDVTQEREAEAAHEAMTRQMRAAQRMEAVGRLAGGVAHDFNNILTVIRSYGEFLREGIQAGEPDAGDAEAVLEAADRAVRLTAQLLAFSRRQPQELRCLDLNETVGGLERMVRCVIGEDVELRVVLGRDLGPVLADGTQIEQVLMNLAVNARDAMPTGGRLTIGTANVDVNGRGGPEGVPPGEWVTIAVEDTGTGMDETTQSHIFEPFFTTKGEGRGTGLGLSTVFGIVKQSRGHIAVETAPGRGTRFRVFLPRVEHEASGTAAPRPAVCEALAGGDETILLVEDDEAVRRTAARILGEHGYRVLEARDAAGALAALDRDEGPLHLVVTDVVLPGASGCEVAARVKAIRPEARILYMSGYTGEVIERQGLDDAEASILPKPFSHDALLRRVREVLGPRGAPR